MDFLATRYRHPGIDTDYVVLTNFAGQTVPITQEGEAIQELVQGSVFENGVESMILRRQNGEHHRKLVIEEVKC